jgi:uncharacterized small protein (DUF1192 family)
MAQNFRLDSLNMLLVTEKSNLATANVHLDFYASKEAKGVELDFQERSDKEFWVQNVDKINERMAFIEAEIAIEKANEETHTH